MGPISCPVVDAPRRVDGAPSCNPCLPVVPPQRLLPTRPYINLLPIPFLLRMQNLVNQFDGEGIQPGHVRADVQHRVVLDAGLDPQVGHQLQRPKLRKDVPQHVLSLGGLLAVLFRLKLRDVNAAAPLGLIRDRYRGGAKNPILLALQQRLAGLLRVPMRRLQLAQVEGVQVAVHLDAGVLQRIVHLSVQVADERLRAAEERRSTPGQAKVCDGNALAADGLQHGGIEGIEPPLGALHGRRDAELPNAPRVLVALLVVRLVHRQPHEAVELVRDFLEGPSVVLRIGLHDDVRSVALVDAQEQGHQHEQDPRGSHAAEVRPGRHGAPRAASCGRTAHVLMNSKKEAK
eukprot:scaffold1857_cov247-Pinguiococcus_pyrenoidosus.AAC.7